MRPDVVIVDIVLRDGPSDQVVERLVSDGIPFIVHSGEHPGMHVGSPFAKRQVGSQARGTGRIGGGRAGTYRSGLTPTAAGADISDYVHAGDEDPDSADACAAWVHADASASAVP